MNYYRITFKQGRVFTLHVKTSMTATELHGYLQKRSDEQIILSQTIVALKNEGMHDAVKALSMVYDNYAIKDSNGYTVFPYAIISGLIGTNPIPHSNPSNVIDWTQNESNPDNREATLYNLRFTGMDGHIKSLLIKSYRDANEMHDHMLGMRDTSDDMQKSINLLRNSRLPIKLSATGKIIHEAAIESISEGINKLRIGEHHIDEITRIEWVNKRYEEEDYVLIEKDEKKSSDMAIEVYQ